MSEPDLRYPIGRFEAPPLPADRDPWLEQLTEAPALLRAAVAGLDDGRLDIAYRPGGWTVRQVVHHLPDSHMNSYIRFKWTHHHLPDSHMNSYIRFKWTLTEAEPVIKAYSEADWAELADSRGPIEPSLLILDALHRRWLTLLQAMTDSDYQRTFEHPETGRHVSLTSTLALYAWHGRHHVAHITALRERLGW